MKILVTGANGYLGSGVVKRLCDDGFPVIATDFKNDSIDSRATVVLGDLFDMDDPFSALGKPDVLLHMAWRDGFVHNSPNHLIDLPRHALFLRKMISGGIKRIAVLGTMHEIGFVEGPIDENTPCRPESYYGISKNALRQITKLECDSSNVRFQWFRGFYIVGAMANGNSIFSKIVQAERRGDLTFPFTTGTNQFDFLDYDDFSNYLAKAVEQEKVLGVINICSGRPERLADRVERFIKDNGFKIKLEYGKYPDRVYDSKAVWGDGKKIRQKRTSRA